MDTIEIKKMSVVERLQAMEALWDSLLNEESEIENEIAYVVAVLPMRRDPAWIERKLKERS